MNNDELDFLIERLSYIIDKEDMCEYDYLPLSYEEYDQTKNILKKLKEERNKSEIINV